MGISRHVGAVQHTGGHSGVPGGQLGRSSVFFLHVSCPKAVLDGDIDRFLAIPGVGAQDGEPLSGSGPRPVHWSSWHAQRLSQESISMQPLSTTGFCRADRTVPRPRTRNKTFRAGVDAAFGGSFGDLAARGGSATHRRSLRCAGRAARPVISLFLTCFLPQSCFGR